MSNIKKRPIRQTAPRKLPSQDRAKKSVERILSAVTSLLDEHGYDHLTTITIAKKAGISVGSVYQYFPNKHAIMCTITQRWLAEDNKVLETVEEQEDQYEGFLDAITDLTDRLIQVYEDQKGLLALYHLIHNIPELHEMEIAHDKQYAQRLENMIDRYNLKCTTVERKALAYTYTSIVDSIAMQTAGKPGEHTNLKRKFLKQMIHDLFKSFL